MRHARAAAVRQGAALHALILNAPPLTFSPDTTVTWSRSVKESAVAERRRSVVEADREVLTIDSLEDSRFAAAMTALVECVRAGSDKEATEPPSLPPR